MQPMFFQLPLVVMVFSLVIGLVGCAKSEAPQSPGNSQQSVVPQQSNVPLPSPANKEPPQQATSSSAGSRKAKVDACALLTSKEIQSVQGEPLKDSKPSESADGGFSVSQCFFTLPTFTKSVALTVTQRSDGSGGRDPKEFWQNTFHREKASAKERDRDKGEERESESTPPRKISGLGDEAFWGGSRVGGALYVLKGKSFIRVSIGGPDAEQVRINKSKALAQMVLKHL